MMSIFSDVSGQGTLSFGNVSFDAASGFHKVPVNWTTNAQIGTINLLNISVAYNTVGGGSNPCFNKGLTESSAFAGIKVVANAGVTNVSLTGSSFSVPTPSVTLFTLFFTSADPIPQTANLSFTFQKFFKLGVLSTIGTGTPSTISFAVPNSGLTLSGFIERPGTPAPQCSGVPNAGIPNVNVAITPPAGSIACFATNTTINTGMSGTYSPTVRQLSAGLTYSAKPTTTNGNSCGVTSLDAGILNQHILDIVPFTQTFQFYSADLTLDGFANQFDVAPINKIVAGTFTPPVGYTSWKFIPTSVYPTIIIPPLDQALPIVPDFALFSANPAPGFIGIKRGDINQSCSTCNQLNFAPPVTDDRNDSNQSNISLIIPTESMKTGEKRRIPIGVENFGQTLAFSFGLHFDRNKIQLLGAADADLPIAYGALNPDDKLGALKYSWTSDKIHGDVLSDDSKLVWIEIAALQDITDISELFYFSEKDIPNEFFDNKLNRGGQFQLKQKADLSNDVTITASPNPFAETATIEYNLPNSGIVNLKIVDMSGRQISHFSGEMLTGTHTWQPEGLENLPNGLYFCQIQTINTQKSIKLAKH